MSGSRTVKTLTALVVCMTIGAFALMWMEIAPIIPSATPLSAVAAEMGVESSVAQTAVPLDPDRWRNIILHSAAEGGGVVENCHFIVNGSQIKATDAWREQRYKNHVVNYVRGQDYNRNSIAICVMSDFYHGSPAKDETAALLRLTQTLQKACRIDRSNVFFYRDINESMLAPYRPFADAVTAGLLKVD